MKLLLHSPFGVSRTVLGLSLIAVCGIAAEPPNLFQRLGHVFSRASNQPQPDRTFDTPSTAPRRYQSAYQDARPSLRTRPAGPARYGEATRRDKTGTPRFFDKANVRSSLRFQPGTAPPPTEYLVESTVMPVPASVGNLTSGGPRETIRLPLDPPGIVPAPDLTVPAAPPTPQAAVNPVPRPTISFANSASYGRVKMSFPPYTELDVQGLASGSLAQDPISGKIFRVP
ncbi:MAG: hypothetical protein ABL974_09320 [Prosthecobacter sp.]